MAKAKATMAKGGSKSVAGMAPLQKKGFGKGSGGKGGKMVWIPAPSVPMFMKKKGGGKGLVKGKGKGTATSKIMDKLAKLDSNLKVWVGGLDEKTTWKALQKHFEELATKPKLTEIMRKGRACCGFETPEDADAAISSVNGSDLEGASLEVDVWTQKEREPREKKASCEKNQKAKLVKGKLAKAVLKKPDSKIAVQMKETDPSLKVWIGGLSEKTTWKQLAKHFEENGYKPKLSDLMKKKGTACVSFENESDVSDAISALNGTDLDGNSIEVDSWEKPERKKIQKSDD